jgi:two-component system OmpR family response regulator
MPLSPPPSPALLPRIAVFEPEAARAVWLVKALDLPQAQLVALGDPALSVRDWLSQAWDLVLCNPFASVGHPADVTALCRRLAATRPVFALTQDDVPGQRTLVLSAGADDVMAMPLVRNAPDELAARIGALLRRRALANGRLACDDLEVDLIRRSVRRGDRAIRLPAREFELLAELARTPDQVVPRDHLLRSVWRLDFDPGTNRIEVHMSRLRGRVDQGESFPMLRTAKGHGYALVSRVGLLADAMLPANGPMP